jgi:hypothetical protein
VDSLDRARVRATFEDRFTVERMAREYVEIYRNLPAVRRAILRSAGLSAPGVSNSGQTDLGAVA